jgi:D-methionine transport system substrate-binding protein
LEAAQLVNSLEDASISVINGNYALQGGLIPAEDALALESGENNPYVNIVAVKHGNEGNPAVRAFVTLITSEEVRIFIENKYDGSVISAISAPTLFPK